MALTPIEKEKRKKKERKYVIIVVSVLCVLCSYMFLHWKALINEQTLPGRKKEYTFDFGQLLIHCITKPLHMELTLANFGILLGIFLVIGFIVFNSFLTSSLKKHDNADTVKGSAHFMTQKELDDYNKKFTSPFGVVENDGADNMILSKDLRLSMNNRKTRRNNNQLVIGGSGAGKTRFCVGPNLLQYNCSLVFTDPSGELLRDYGKALENNGYKVKVFNLTDVYRSSRYNPFHYIKEEKDVFIVVNALIQNTTPKDAKGGDPFWEKSEQLLLNAIMLYLWHSCPEEEQTMAAVSAMIDQAKVDENDSSVESPLDKLFAKLEREDPTNLAVSQYKKFKQGAGKTLQGILISVGVRMQAFDLSDIKYLTSADDLHLESFADTKQALFIILPTGDNTFNFLASLLYTQLFSALYLYCETRSEFSWKAQINDDEIFKVEQALSSKDSERAKHEIERYVRKIKKGLVIEYDEERKLYNILTKKDKDGKQELIAWRGTESKARELAERLNDIKAVKMPYARCPYHVRFMLDEFANIGSIPNFSEKLATIRKYEMSCTIILQALSQLKTMYKDDWNTITSNCDTKLFLGCDDTETIKWLIEVLGKKTTTVENMSFQSKGDGSTSYNKDSIELMTVDQISLMADDECLVRVRGCQPYFGKKYNLEEHPNYEEAMELKGQYEIPCDVNVEKYRNVSLYKRKMREKILEQQQKGSEQKTDPSDGATQKEKPVNGEQPAEKNNGSARNAENISRRDEAKRAKEDLEKMDSEHADPKEMSSDEIEALFELDEGMEEEQIIEVVESLITLESVNLKAVQYGITN